MSGDGVKSAVDIEIESLRVRIKQDEGRKAVYGNELERIREIEARIRSSKSRIALLIATSVGGVEKYEGVELAPREPTAKELSFRIDELEYRVKELETFGSPAVSAEADAESSFRWITDRAPTGVDASAGNVAIFSGESICNYTHSSFLKVTVSAIPWMTIQQAASFTKDNPAPSPYDQEVSG